MTFSLGDGEEFVRLARKSIEYASAASGSLLAEKCPKKEYSGKCGVFVTLETYPAKELRGCIGFPEPVKPLWNAIIEVAAGAAFHDPRFMQLQASELDKIIVEVSVLTPPKKINAEKPEELLKKVEIGRDGLIAESGLNRGLLLAIVPVEQRWNVQEFLEHACMKAGIPKDSWKEKGTAFYKFETQVFAEEKPKGKVAEIDLKPE